MRKLMCLIALAWMGATLLNAAPARAESNAEQQAVFDLLYAEDVKKARLTSDSSDDIALARLLSEATVKASAHEHLLWEISDAAWQLGIRHEESQDAAVEAMKVVAANLPAKRSLAERNITAHYDRAYRAARPSRRRPCPSTAPAPAVQTIRRTGPPASASSSLLLAVDLVGVAGCPARAAPAPPHAIRAGQPG